MTATEARDDRVFAALADATRHEVLRLLRDEGPQPVQALADHFAMRRPSLPEHVKVLREAGLVSGQRAGRQRIYRLEEAQPPAEVWRALTEPELFARWQMPGADGFRLEVGHRYAMTSVPRPGSGFSGTVDVEVLAYGAGRMLSVRRADADPGNPADRTVTRTLEHEGRGTRLFLVHEGFDPDDPARMTARKIMGVGWRSHVMPTPGETLDRLWA